MCNKVEDAIEAYRLRKQNQEPDSGEIYLEQKEYINLMMDKYAIQRVRELHSPTTIYDNSCGDPECCGSGAGGEWIECEECFELYPCRTIKALDSEQNE